MLDGHDNVLVVEPYMQHLAIDPVRDVHKDMQASFTNVLENVPDAVAVNVGACVGGTS